MRDDAHRQEDWLGEDLEEVLLKLEQRDRETGVARRGTGIRQFRAWWPQIQQQLDAGHTAHRIWEALTQVRSTPERPRLTIRYKTFMAHLKKHQAKAQPQAALKTEEAPSIEQAPPAATETGPQPLRNPAMTTPTAPRPTKAAGFLEQIRAKAPRHAD